MSTFVFANNVNTTLAAPVLIGATTITLSSSANLPAIPGGTVFALALTDAATQTNLEIVYATAVSGANLTVLRGREGTSARAWLALDLAFAADTAGILASFVQASGADFVQLSPGAPQTGFIDVSGAVTAGLGTFVGVNAGGPLTGATTGAFSSDVTALDHIASRGYANTATAFLPFRLNGQGGVVGIGASTGLSTQGVTASLLGIGLAGLSAVASFDVSGNLGLSNSLHAVNAVLSTSLSVPSMSGTNIGLTGTMTAATVSAANGFYSTQVTAPTLLNNGNQVLTQVRSTDGTISAVQSGASVNISIAASPIILKWFSSSGVQQPNPKIVSGSVFCAGGVTTVNLSGAGVFTNAGTYVVLTAVEEGAPPSTASAYPQNVNGSQFQLFQANPSTCNWIALGY